MNENFHEKSEKSDAADRAANRRSKWWLLLLLIPLVGLLYPPFYSSINPTLGGVPFFIWYQFAWVLGGVATTLAVTGIRG